MSDFLHVTAKFNKRFYTKLDHRSESPDSEEHWYLVFNAIAISRDLIYEFYWNVPCNRDLKLNKTWDEYLKGEVPLHGLVPFDPDIKNHLYPHHADGQWQDRFRYEGFVEVSDIEGGE